MWISSFEGIESNLIFHQIPTSLACAYLMHHLTRHAKDWYENYAEVRNRTNRAQLLQVISKFEEGYSSRETQGSSTNYIRERRDWDVRRMSTNDSRNRNWINAEVLDQQNDRMDNYKRVDFTRGSKNVLDFHKKSLAIKDSQMEEIQVDERNLGIDFSKSKLNVEEDVSSGNQVKVYGGYCVCSD
ncbi:hypothetical protein TNCV_3225011 [Trichonephila clavipes]|nr:hypothetical protein TNCV_3225011 [Trichonephila clavipes]